MYSRKYIRSALPESSRRELYPAATIHGKNGREPSPPPDYTGTAFADPDALRQRNRQDFPEAVIPPREATPEEAPDGWDSSPSPEEVLPLPLSEETERSPEAEELSVPRADGAAPFDEAVREPIIAETTPTKQQGQTPEEAPLLSLGLLRSLTLEDLMLYWMLLMLLTCSQEDQVYLLLGLLLLNR